MYMKLRWRRGKGVEGAMDGGVEGGGGGGGV